VREATASTKEGRAMTTTEQPKNTPFVLIWIALTSITLFTVTIPADRVAIVCLVLGPRAYFHDGVRLANNGKPGRFTTGQLIPPLQSAIVWLGSFLLTIIVVLVVMYIVASLVRRLFGWKLI
jgi:hypothetical protein